MPCRNERNRWENDARGTRALVRTTHPATLAVYDAATEAPQLLHRHMLTGRPYEARVLDDAVLFANGQHGVQRIPLAE